MEADILALLSDSLCTLSHFKKGTSIYREREFSRSLGIILAGGASVTKDTDDGRGLSISRLERGSIFGAAAMFNNSTVYVTIIKAVSDCLILFLPQEFMLRAMKENFKIAENYIRYLSGRILFLNSKISSLSAGSTERRVAHCLLDLYEKTGSADISVSMTELANSLNIGRASLYRAFDVLESSSAISRIGKKVTILDISKFKNI